MTGPLQRSSLASMGAFGLLLVAASACVDPLYDERLDELGGEQPGFNPGSRHRPGQPCLRCHSDYGGNELVMSMAGTVFVEPEEGVELQMVMGVSVQLYDSEGKVGTAFTNECGNFYLTPRQFEPAFPVRAELWGYLGGQGLRLLRPMASRIGREGACGGCHIHPASPTSPGVVFVPRELLPLNAIIAAPDDCPEPRFAEAP